MSVLIIRALYCLGSMVGPLTFANSHLSFPSTPLPYNGVAWITTKNSGCHLAVSPKLGVHFLAVLVTRALPFWGFVRALRFLETPTWSQKRTLTCSLMLRPHVGLWRKLQDGLGRNLQLSTSLVFFIWCGILGRIPHGHNKEEDSIPDQIKETKLRDS